MLSQVRESPHGQRDYNCYCEGADAMSILKIALLGPPEVSHFDRRLTFPDRKALALLAYFAAEGGMQRASAPLAPILAGE
jgi:hypothetical protein